MTSPEEKRYIRDLPKRERSNAIKVIPNQYTVWDKMDFYGPNLTAQNIVDFFKNKYNVEIDNINFNDKTLVSTLLNEEENLERDKLGGREGKSPDLQLRSQSTC